MLNAFFQMCSYVDKSVLNMPIFLNVDVRTEAFLKASRHLFKLLFPRVLLDIATGMEIRAHHGSIHGWLLSHS